MKLQKHIGFIGGGQMGEALIKGIIRSELATHAQILAVDPDRSRREYLSDTYGIAVSENAAPVWEKCEIVILAVKPQVMAKVLDGSKEMMTGSHLIISIAAGITISFLEEHTGRRFRFIRVMPNMPALILEAASALSGGSLATAEDMAQAVTIFEAIGKTVVVEENLLDAVTGLSGSGPAYVFSFIEALIDGGIKVGLSRATAQALVLQTILGATKMAAGSNEHPAQLRALVTSPGGTTIAGLHELEIAGFGGIIMNAVEAATRRSAELGR